MLSTPTILHEVLGKFKDITPRKEIQKMNEIDRKIVEYMVSNAKENVDGTGRFKGSPRGFMESVGVSSGPRYQALYDMEIRRSGRGANAVWTIPADLMRETGSVAR